jgi:hypothetical protein
MCICVDQRLTSHQFTMPDDTPSESRSSRSWTWWALWLFILVFIIYPLSIGRSHC